MAIARALAKTALPLADEPTGNLDSTTGRQIIKLLLDVNRSRGTTLVLVTHDPELAAVADMSRAPRRAGRRRQDADAGRDYAGTTGPGPLMTFVLAWPRELRASWRRLLFFFVCVAIGVAAIVDAPIDHPERPHRPDARSARDHRLRRARPEHAAVDAEIRAELEQRLGEAPVSARTEAIETATMVRAEDGARSRGWSSCAAWRRNSRFTAPRAAERQPYSHDLLRGQRGAGAARAADAAGHQGRRQILIGGQPFTIRGVIDQDRGAASAGSARVARPRRPCGLRPTGLLAFGSRANYQIC